MQKLLIVDHEFARGEFVHGCIADAPLETTITDSVDDAVRTIRENADLLMAFVAHEPPNEQGLNVLRVWNDVRRQLGRKIPYVCAYGDLMIPQYERAAVEAGAARCAELRADGRRTPHVIRHILLDMGRHLLSVGEEAW